MDDINKKIGERVRQIRKKAKLTQAETGELLGVEKATVSKYETGDAKLSPKSLAILAEIGNTTVDWIILGEERAGYVAEAPNPYNEMSAARQQLIAMCEGITETKVEELLGYLRGKREIPEPKIDHEPTKEEQDLFIEHQVKRAFLLSTLPKDVLDDITNRAFEMYRRRYIAEMMEASKSLESSKV